MCVCVRSLTQQDHQLHLHICIKFNLIVNIYSQNCFKTHAIFFIRHGLNWSLIALFDDIKLISKTRGKKQQHCDLVCEFSLIFLFAIHSLLTNIYSEVLQVFCALWWMQSGLFFNLFEFESSWSVLVCARNFVCLRYSYIHFFNRWWNRRVALLATNIMHSTHIVFVYNLIVYNIKPMQKQNSAIITHKIMKLR